MTATLEMPTTELSPQRVALLNLAMLMNLEGKHRKDLALHMNKMPQSISRMLGSDYKWSFNDMCAAAEFVGVPIGALVDPTLSPARALDIIGENGIDAPEGGQPVVSNDDSRRPAGHGWPVANLTLAA